jgi:putative DNA primase/helicase
MVELAKSAYPLRLHVDDLDQRPWLFTAANGTIDLTTGQPVASDPTNLITRRANAAFAPQARCPRWERFIGEIFAGQDEVVRFAQEFLGYSLTGSTTESIMLILHGQGSNGKSVMLEVISHVLGSYAQEAAPTAFIVQRNTDTLRNDLAMLRGARLVTAMETSETARLDMATVKRITGGDRITARFLHQEFFSYVPQFKLLLATNAMPEVTGADTGTWRRLGMLPFSVQFGQPGHPPAANKERLAADLKQEAPGILNWLVQGCLRWQQQGLSKPTEVAAATADYRDEQDLLAAFVDDCIECGAHLRTLKVEAYVRYVEWAEERRMRPIGRRVFSQQLAARGFTALRTGQAHYWAGFALKTTPSTFTVLDGGLR